MTTTNEQRIYERRQSSIEDVQGPRDGAPQWLNSVDVVDGLVRRFGAEVLRRVSMGPGGHLQSWCESKCLQMNGLFLGFGRNDEAHPGYSRGIWNTEHQLGVSISIRLRLNAPTRLAVRDAFMLFALRLVQAVDSAGSEAEVDAALDREVATMRDALLGL